MPAHLGQSPSTDDRLRAVILKLIEYCHANNWAGYDPYDAVNSRAFVALPFLNSRIPRLIACQALKRSPINLRKILLIPKTQNPKAIALFLSAFLKLSKIGIEETGDLVEQMIQRLGVLRSKGNPYWSWGYSFPWQTRTILVPEGAPNLVCTTFVGHALLDAYEHRQDQRCLNMAASAAEYILDRLYWTEGPSIGGFSYPVPELRNAVANANLLGAAFLSRVHRHTNDPVFLEPALRVARYTMTKQRVDGSWFYGEASSQRWIDNFHTGYNLCALRSIGRYAETAEFEPCLRRGFEFYLSHFFRADGAPKYFHNQAYPIDIHSVAQSIITLVSLKDLAPSNVRLAHAVFEWAMKHMWDERGSFYYRVLRFFTNKIAYMRWAQAWMLLAMSTLLCESDAEEERPGGRNVEALAQAS